METIARIERLLAEAPSAAETRERASFTQALQGTDGSVVLFGAGRLGCLGAKALRRAGIPFRGFCDSDPTRVGTRSEDAEIFSPAEAARRFGESSLFVVAIWTGTATENMNARIAFLTKLGCRRVVPFPALLWSFAEEALPLHACDRPSRVLRASAEIRRLAGLLGDEPSLKVLEEALQQRLWASFADAPPSPEQYFPAGVVKLGTGERVADGGAFDGDTLAEFVGRTGGRFAAYHAFEPDAGNAARLRRRIEVLDSAVRAKISVHEIALHAETTELDFAQHGGQTSRVDGRGGSRVRAEPLDGVLRGEAVTFFKLDVEGAEKSALLGAQQILRAQRPLTAVCVYHRPPDLWEIPLLLHQLMPASRLFLRQHGFDGWEMVCYAVPR